MAFAGIVLELAHLLREPISEAARACAALHLTDWLGNTVLGLRSAEARALSKWLREQPTGKASALGGQARHLDAAVAHNACLAASQGLDDLHRPSSLHPGRVVIPAALAMAEQLGVSGPRLLDAIVRGYEAMLRIGQALGPGHARVFDPIATAGGFGAAAAVADLLELDPEATAHALGLAGSHGLGFQPMEDGGAMNPAWQAAQAAQGGLRAALWARRGFTGPWKILESPRGLFPALSDGNPAEVLLPAEDWRLLEVSLNPWPGGHVAGAAIDATRRLRIRLAGNRPDEVTVLAPRSALAAFVGVPSSPEQARRCPALAVAVALLKERPGIDDLESPTPEALELASRVSFPPPAGNERLTIVRVRCGDSAIEEGLTDAWGDPGWPMSVAEVEDKALRGLMRGGVEREAGLSLLALARALPEARQLTELSRRLSAIAA